jgi:hypothetical protein
MADLGKKKQRPRGPGKPFQKGMSGNPDGKPKGTRCRVTVLAEKILEDERDAIVQAVVDAAKAGDPTAMRLCIERLIPVRKGRPITFTLPRLATTGDVAKALGAIAVAMAAGELTPEEASTVAAVIEAKRKAIETMELESRIAALEQRAGKK